MPQSLEAQSRILFNVELKSGNFWSASFLGLPIQILDGLLSEDEESVLGSTVGLNYRVVNYKNYGSTLECYGDNRQPHFKNLRRNAKQIFGFKAEDLFRDFEYSVKFGWQPMQIPVGIYGRIGYAHETFKFKFTDEGDWIKHRINSFRPGIGIRISPMVNLLDEYGVAPIVEFGSTYNYHFSYRGGIDDDKDELNDGLSSHVALGVKLESGAILFDIERDHYDLFNKDYEYQGSKPYAHLTSNRWNFNITFTRDF